MHRSEWYPLRIASVGMLGLFVFLNWAGTALVTLMVGQLLEIVLDNCYPQPSCEGQ